jgi:hypothetical protein
VRCGDASNFMNIFNVKEDSWQKATHMNGPSLMEPATVQISNKWIFYGVELETEKYGVWTLGECIVLFYLI